MDPRIHITASFKGGKMIRRVFAVIGTVLLLSYVITVGAECASPPANMTAWWPADGTAEDLVGDNDGTAIGATFVSGMVDQAFSFDGNDDYLSVPDDPSLRATSEITFEFWVNFNTLPSGPFSSSLAICEKDNDYVLSWRADTQRLELSFFDTLASPGYRIGANILLADITGVWHHIAITSANSVGQPTAEFHFYLDGVEEPNFPNVNSPSVLGGWNTGASGELYIGRRTQISSGELYFDGIIDELTIFDRMLDPSEIAEIHAAGSDGKCKGPLTGLIFEDGFETGDTTGWSATEQ